MTTTQLAGRIAGAAAAYLLLEHASEPLAGLTLPSAGEVFVIVGPEGGVTPAEVERLCSAGARPVRLGSTVLRSSSAGPAALAVLNAAGPWR